ncbi:hypothetical protein LOZ61_003941 [Ophidiomyces ophidiicola]|uniref:Uncharacterized protein n=1 Tax=Ophidiomyces ophidiicola TaxID=1387563 RepID=A0ACB8UN16_9EURO|nr:hypothetical protein LOZ61_003941 [Ophidiomyces ophidiicola]KAI1923084.1 hypothetical protein LOZ60_005396 [Ophidiomyces ophidiicola]KAI2145069.1 hypothetical protein LOZ27_003448 [Ophidiomyces ophidiicola]KAI2149883.1 hypothetical protein LOZ25_006690 [Ophidiomyces ophidiicola]KAI2185698.1 hypothetical protein LOZ20_006747 [Ophidiomyces ophidiicola]
MSKVPFLVSGASSGLGGAVLATLFKHVPDPAHLAAASSRPEAAEGLQREYPGTQFRVLDYNDAEQMVPALTGVEKFFFVSSPEIDTLKRERQHENAVAAAKRAGVGHVYYASLAFGGYGSDSKVGVQQAHLTTERLLAESGLAYTAVRMGLYTEAFPLFTSWYPDSTTIYVSSDGPMALTSREELGEATAQLMLRDVRCFPHNIALLTAARAYTLRDVVRAAAAASGQAVTVQTVARGDLPALLTAADARAGRGRKSRQFFDAWAGVLDALAAGEAATVDGLMAELLGRAPRDGLQHVGQLVSEGAAAGGYRWHQSYMRR